MNRQQRRAAVKSGKNPDALAALWFSNSPHVGTGYGTQTAQVIERFKRDGHAIAVSSNYGAQGAMMEWEGVPVYPMGYEAYSNDVAAANFRNWTARNPGLPAHLFVLFDAWVLKGPHWDELPVSIWTMVDHVPVPAAVQQILEKPNITPIAVTRFGQQEIERQGVAAEYIPMAIDTKLYTPTDSFQGTTGRQMMGLDEDCFVVSLVNANKGVPGRKAWGENLTAAAIFAARHDDVRVYIHTERFGNMSGQNLDPLIKAVGLKDHQFRFVNQYAQHLGIPNEAMAALFTATDVLLAPTYGEGFGLTALEAAGCGTPVIVNDFSAQPELVGEGWLTEGQPWWDAPQFAWWNIPSIPSIVDCLEQAYQRGRGRSKGQMEHAAMYDADRVWEMYWRPYLAKLAQPGPMTSPVPVADGWTRNDDIEPLLGIYIPAYKRDTLGRLLASLAPQLTDRVEVIISDDDPAGSGRRHVTEHLSDSPARIEYSARRRNLGPDANILRGLEVGSAPWVWMIGDDDWVLPGAVETVLGAIEVAGNTDLDRVILASEHTSLPNKSGSMAELAGVDPALPIAATLITANVVRRSALDLRLGHEKLDTMYGWAWANTSCREVYVTSVPCIAVGTDHVDSYPGMTELGRDGVVAIWSDLLRGYGIEPTVESFGWNYVNAAQEAQAVSA